MIISGHNTVEASASVDRNSNSSPREGERQIATIEAPPAASVPIAIPTVTCDLASDISTSDNANDQQDGQEQKDTLKVKYFWVNDRFLPGLAYLFTSQLSVPHLDNNVSTSRFLKVLQFRPNSDFVLSRTQTITFINHRAGNKLCRLEVGFSKVGRKTF